jgi:hypothetical protein
MASRFLYNAYAVGFSGHITRPQNEVISSQAVSALAPAGGYSSACQPPYKLLGIVSHEGTTSETVGTIDPLTLSHDTSVIATVRGLNIRNVVLLESCTASLNSVHPVDGAPPRISVQGSVFHNLWVAGRKIELESRVDLYTELDTLDKLRQRYEDEKDPAFRERFLEEAHAGKEHTLPEKLRKFFPWRKLTEPRELPVSKGTGTVIVPLFIVLNPSAPGFIVRGNVIYVENFGSITLGELIITSYERRVTMLQVEMGSSTGGNMCAAIGAGNGGTTDPS